MKQQYHVELTEEERKHLQKHRQGKKYSLESKKRAGVLLALNESENLKPPSVKDIASRNGVSEGSCP